MENQIVQIIGAVAASALCLLALCALAPDGVSRLTEALFERIEIRLAQRARRRRAARAPEELEPLSFFEPYAKKGAHR